MKRLHAQSLDSGGYREIADVLGDGGVVCMPTDTVYGLAVDTRQDPAIERLYKLKGREPSRPMILLVDSIAMARGLAEAGDDFDRLANRFWPGPISFVLPARPAVSSLLTAGTGTIALRWPDFELAVRVVRELGAAITSTSANLSGRPVIRSADEVVTALGEVDLVVDAGRLEERPPSTLIDLTSGAPELLREGPVRFDEISRFQSPFRSGPVAGRSA